MNCAAYLNGEDHHQIKIWLQRALSRSLELPKLTPDESPYLGVLRIEKSVKPAARDSIRAACGELIRVFAKKGDGDPFYLEELIALSVSFKDPESIESLASLALRFHILNDIPLGIKRAVLGALVDVPPPRKPAFWKALLEKDPDENALFALSGLLATDYVDAISILPKIPDNELLGSAAALKLDLTWDGLDSANRFALVRKVRATLDRCGLKFATSVRAWAASKYAGSGRAVSPTLLAALTKSLGANEMAPQRYTPKLCSQLAA